MDLKNTVLDDSLEIKARFVSKRNGIIRVSITNNLTTEIPIDTNFSSGLNEYISIYGEKKTNVILFSINGADTLYHFPTYDYTKPFSRLAKLSSKAKFELGIDLNRFFDWTEFLKKNDANEIHCLITIYYYYEQKWNSKFIEVKT